MVQDKEKKNLLCGTDSSSTYPQLSRLFVGDPAEDWVSFAVLKHQGSDRECSSGSFLSRDF